MKNQITKDNYMLVKTQEVSLDHPDTTIIVDGKEYTLSFKNVKIYIYEENEEYDKKDAR